MDVLRRPNIPTSLLESKPNSYPSHGLSSLLCKVVEIFRSIIKDKQGICLLDQLLPEYERRTGQKLDLSSVGFNSVFDFVANLKETFDLKKVDNGKFIVCNPEFFANLDNTPADFGKLQSKRKSFNSLTIDRIKTLLEMEYPDGLNIEELVGAYKGLFGASLTDLDHRSYGYHTLEDLLRAYPQIMTVQNWGGAVRVTSGQSHISSKEKQTACEKNSPLPKELVCGSSYKCLDLSTLMPEGGLAEVVIGEVYSPNNFWMIYRSLHTSRALHELMERINAFYESPISGRYMVQKDVITVGSPVVAQYCNDLNYYRAIVTSLDDLTTVKLFFVDYGTTFQCDYSALRLLHQRFMELPAQAIRASLCDVYPKTGGRLWPRLSSERFLELIQNKALVAHIISSKKKTVSVCLWDTNGQEDINIGELLVAEGYAVSQITPVRNSLHVSSSSDLGHPSRVPHPYFNKRSNRVINTEMNSPPKSLPNAIPSESVDTSLTNSILGLVQRITELQNENNALQYINMMSGQLAVVKSREMSVSALLNTLHSPVCSAAETTTTNTEHKHASTEASTLDKRVENTNVAANVLMHRVPMSPPPGFAPLPVQQMPTGLAPSSVPEKVLSDSPLVTKISNGFYSDESENAEVPPTFQNQKDCVVRVNYENKYTFHLLRLDGQAYILSDEISSVLSGSEDLEDLLQQRSIKLPSVTLTYMTHQDVYFNLLSYGANAVYDSTGEVQAALTAYHLRIFPWMLRFFDGQKDKDLLAWAETLCGIVDIYDDHAHKKLIEGEAMDEENEDIIEQVNKDEPLEKLSGSQVTGAAPLSSSIINIAATKWPKSSEDVTIENKDIIEQVNEDKFLEKLSGSQVTGAAPLSSSIINIAATKWPKGSGDESQVIPRAPLDAMSGSDSSVELPIDIEIRNSIEKLKEWSKSDPRFHEQIRIIELLRTKLPFNPKIENDIFALLESTKALGDQVHTENDSTNLEYEECNDDRQMSIGLFLQSMRERPTNKAEVRDLELSQQESNDYKPQNTSERRSKELSEQESNYNKSLNESVTRSKELSEEKKSYKSQNASVTGSKELSEEIDEREMSLGLFLQSLRGNRTDKVEVKGLELSDQESDDYMPQNISVRSNELSEQESNYNKSQNESVRSKELSEEKKGYKSQNASVTGPKESLEKESKDYTPQNVSVTKWNEGLVSRKDRGLIWMTPKQVQSPCQNLGNATPLDMPVKELYNSQVDSLLNSAFLPYKNNSIPKKEQQLTDDCSTSSALNSGQSFSTEKTPRKFMIRSLKRQSLQSENVSDTPSRECYRRRLSFERPSFYEESDSSSSSSIIQSKSVKENRPYYVPPNLCMMQYNSATVSHACYNWPMGLPPYVYIKSVNSWFLQD